MPRARNDLLRIGDHIAVDSPPAAEKWLARLATAAERAASLSVFEDHRLFPIDDDELA